MSKKKQTCLYCGKEFEVPNWQSIRRKFCSYECSNKGRTTDKNINKKRICAGCGEEYLPTTWNQKWCSRDCFCKNSKTGKKSKPKTCPTCKKEFTSVRTGQRFCSRACAYKSRKKPKRKAKKIKLSTLDNWWSKLIKLKAGNKCEYCGKTTTLNSHHIFSRSNHNLRWEEENGVCLCVSHHVFGNMSAHKAPIEFVEWLKDKRGERWYEDLRHRAKQTQDIDKKEVREKLINRVHQLEKNYDSNR